MITTVTGKNQITIPAEIARALDIQPGTRLDWEIGEDGTLIVRPLPRRGQLAREAAGMGRQWLSEGADPVGDLIRNQDDFTAPKRHIIPSNYRRWHLQGCPILF